MTRIGPMLALAVPALALAGAQARASESSGLRTGTIGVALLQPGSGPFAAHNLALARGVTVAVQQLNGAGGIDKKVRVELVTRHLAAGDDASRTVASLPKSARVVILPCNVDETNGLASAASKSGRLVLAPCNPDPAATARIPRVWPIAMSGSDQVTQLVDYTSTNRAKSVFILTSKPATRYETVLAAELRATAQRAGMHIAGEGVVPLAGGKVSNLAKAIEKSKAQVVFTPIYSPHIASIIVALRASHLSTAFFGTDGMDAQLNLKQYSGDALKDVYFTSYGFARTTSRPFFRRYAQQFHSVPAGSFPALGLETVRTLEAAVTKAGSTDPGRIDATFAKGFQVSGVGLADRTYPGGGARRPVADVGLVELIRNAYFPLESSVPAAVAAH